MKPIVIICLFLSSLLLLSQAKEEDEHKAFLSLVRQYVETEKTVLIAEEGIRAVRFKDEEKQVYYFIQSNDYVQLMGYEGITNLAIIIDSAGKVESISIIDSEDTPYFIRRIVRSDFLEQFAGYPDVDELIMVTGATISCEAIIDTVNKTVELFTDRLQAHMKED